MPVITCSAAQRRRGRLRRARCCRSRQPWRTGYGGIPSPGGGLRTAAELVGCERHQLVSIAAFDPSCRAEDVWEQPRQRKICIAETATSVCFSTVTVQFLWKVLAFSRLRLTHNGRHRERSRK